VEKPTSGPGNKPTWLAETAEGVILNLRVQPGARRNAIEGVLGDRLKMKVTQPPTDGRANEAVLNLLIKTFGVKRSRLSLLSGVSSRDKRVLLHGVDVEEIASHFHDPPHGQPSRVKRRSRSH
jgi:uncharacterized protein